jgi:hypothetical protein
MTHTIKYFFITVCLLAGVAFNANAQSAKDIRGAAPVVQLTSEPAPILVVDQPLPEQLALGRVVVQYRTENLRILPVYGAAAKNVSPRIGHLHITVDDAPWHWADASNEPLIINGFHAGAHKILVELADPTHKVITSKTITFIVPEHKDEEMSHH